MSRIALRWSLLPFEVMLGFVVAGIAAVFASGLLGLWYEPVGGFVAAIAVVTLSYIRAPKRPVTVAFISYSIVAAVAFGALWERSFYPENYAQSYEPTNMPFWVTLGGGTIAMLGVAAHAVSKVRFSSNTSLERSRD
jgi:hypothetical protein